MANRRNQPLLNLYAALLHLYPANFRRQFGREMLAAFSDVLEDCGPRPGLLLVLCELVPSLFREHLDDPSSLIFSMRLLLCVLPPLGVHAAILPRVQNLDEFVLITFWLICILAALWQTRCRGRECLLRTLCASMAGMLLPIAIINLYQPMIPGFFSLAIPLAVLAATVGLIFAAFARLVMEGVTFNSLREAAV